MQKGIFLAFGHFGIWTENQNAPDGLVNKTTGDTQADEDSLIMLSINNF